MNRKEDAGLYKRSIKGGYWVFVIRLTAQLLEFVKTIIVFNILFEENLELIFVANLLMAGLTTFTESGFRAALVQKKENVAGYLDTAWVIGILRGILLFVAVYFAAPLFASFKVEPDLIPLAISVIRAMGICFLIGAFQNIGTVYFQKELEFHKTFWLRMVGTLTNIVLSISLLLIFRNVWAVVVARLITAAVNLVVSYLLCSYRPKFHFVPEKARELWKFGKWLFGSKIIGYLLNQGDDWFVLFFFPEALPFKLYRGAYRIAYMPATYISSTISQVSFPAYSKIQHDLPRLREAYLKVLQMTALISIPTAFLIFTLSPDFVKLFLVKESHAMIPIIQILAVKGLMGSIGATRSPIFMAYGKPQANWCFHFIRLAILAITIYPLTKLWGIIGTAISTVLVGVLVNPLGTLLICRILSCSIWENLKKTISPLCASIIMAIVLLASKSFFFSETTLLFLILHITIGISTYLISVWLFDFIFRHGLREIIQEQISVIRNDRDQKK